MCGGYAFFQDVVAHNVKAVVLAKQRALYYSQLQNGMFRSWALDVTYSLMLGARGLYGFFACFFSVQMEVSKLYKNSLAISK